MYEKDGEKYFVVDSHMHYWDASPDELGDGRTSSTPRAGSSASTPTRASGRPRPTGRIEHFQKYSEDDLMKDVFEDGYVDVAVFQPTYLKEWYTEGFNTTERNGALAEKHPGKFVVNTRFDPRDGDAGLKELEDNVERWGSKGVKLYTAEWNNGSRGYKLTDPAAYRYLEKAQELGIKNIHVHKGPTIWPLDKDAFDVSDVDHAATDFPDLNFIVEHVGLPRIEDFCFMATQEPNVYAGLSVVIGGLMHARPKFFAKVMGELLFWVGEDKMTFGSDYGIWEPKWQVEGFVDWDYPSDEFSDYPRVTVETKKKILGLNAAKLYGIEVPDGVPARGRRRRRPRRTTPRWSTHGANGVTDQAQVLAALDAVRDPELDEPVTALGFVSSCTVSGGGGRAGPAAAADVLLRAELRLPDGGRRLRRGGGRRRRRAGPRWCSTTTSPPTRSTAGSRPGPGSSSPSRAQADGELDELRTRLRAQGGAGRHRPGLPAAAGRRARRRTSSPALTLGDVPPSADLDRLRARRAELGPAGRRRRRRCWSTPTPGRRSASRRCRCTCAGPG